MGPLWLTLLLVGVFDLPCSYLGSRFRPCSEFSAWCMWLCLFVSLLLTQLTRLQRYGGHLRLSGIDRADSSHGGIRNRSGYPGLGTCCAAMCVASWNRVWVDRRRQRRSQSHAIHRDALALTAVAPGSCALVTQPRYHGHNFSGMLRVLTTIQPGQFIVCEPNFRVQRTRLTAPSSLANGVPARL